MNLDKLKYIESLRGLLCHFRLSYAKENRSAETKFFWLRWLRHFSSGASILPSGNEKKMNKYTECVKEKGKPIPVACRWGPWGCETSRFPYFLDNRLTDGSEVSLTRRPLFTRRKIPGTHFC
jgi:hypothetical protein